MTTPPENPVSKPAHTPGTVLAGVFGLLHLVVVCVYFAPLCDEHGRNCVTWPVGVVYLWILLMPLLWIYAPIPATPILAVLGLWLGPQKLTRRYTKWMFAVSLMSLISLMLMAMGDGFKSILLTLICNLCVLVGSVMDLRGVTWTALGKFQKPHRPI